MRERPEDAVAVVKEAVFPIMKGDARMARGASYFEVPLFSRLIGRLWTGCSPFEFPDEAEEYEYDESNMPYSLLMKIGRQDRRSCHWLTEDGRPRFGAILNLYPWGQYHLPEGFNPDNYREEEMYDSAGLPDTDQVRELGAWVNMKQIEQDLPVLVHCQAGLNRSALVATTSMIMAGFQNKYVINLIREQRSPICLCNEDFELFVRKFVA